MIKTVIMDSWNSRISCHVMNVRCLGIAESFETLTMFLDFSVFNKNNFSEDYKAFIHNKVYEDVERE